MFSSSEVLFIFQWCVVLFALGIIFFPFTNSVFEQFVDRGYLFSKVIALGAISYLLLVLNILHILQFGFTPIILVAWLYVLVIFFVFKKKVNKKNIPIKLIIFEEIIFIIGIFIWSFIRAHEPSINGLEKFMDFGFVNSIMRTTYQPAVDMWFPPYPINYYYFGHLITAALTTLSLLPSNITYNLMIATLFSFCFSLSFSLGINLISIKKLTRKSFVGGILTAALVALAGNLHTIYSFFKAYNVDNPVPFWNLKFLPSSFPNDYWYPNATRFIPFTIHEFPIYSFVVSDLHGHVTDIIFVLLSIALLYKFFLQKTINKASLALFSLLLAIMYMTNVWDALLYMTLFFIMIVIKNLSDLEFNFKKIKKVNRTEVVTKIFKPIVVVFLLFVVFSLPFNFFFKPFASGVGILCAPTFLTNIGKIGPFLFEANHCQKSTWWELLTLYGFFYFFVFSFLVFILKIKNKKNIGAEDLFIIGLITLATLLIIIPEFVYVKDIYPQHYRANTMFKLVYQSFILLSLSSGYIIVRISSKTKNLLFHLPTVILLGLVFIYPYFAVKAYYGDLKSYSGIDGTVYLQTRYPDDYVAIEWINRNIKNRPVMVEAQGDSYTDYERISANTGLPTILGWTVHEWLWRGTYDIPAPRISEVKDIYESHDINLTKSLLKKYDAKYVYVGGLEHQKYPDLFEDKFKKIGTIVFQHNQTRIYKLAI
ncbi:MAG TPA: DUF2298 domain-containing protein [Patescibacteria group bacterium]|nr:DUF2298 domain-containing protein [Patescibacteria group bacterium]